MAAQKQCPSCTLGAIPYVQIVGSMCPRGCALEAKKMEVFLSFANSVSLLGLP